MDIIFCTDSYLQNINQKFLSHSTLTDTITFTLSNAKEPVIGESYISIDRIKENAKMLKVPYQEEVIRVILHSTLHLCNYSDKTTENHKKMHRLQENYLSQWMVSRETFR